MKLTECALCVAITISQWNGRKYDKKASKEVAEKHGIRENIGRYNKSLLPLVKSLDDIRNGAMAIRLYVYQQTLPYSIDGVRLLPVKNYFEFTQEFNKRVSNWNYLVYKFMSEYPKAVQDAKDELGSLYDEKDYPAFEDMRKKFGINIMLSPVPEAGDFYKTLTEEMASAEAARLKQTYEDAQKMAMQDCWDRLYAVVNKFCERLKDTTAVIREDHAQSMIDNALELCTLLTRLNLTNDTNLETMRQEVERTLCHISPTALSADVSTKEDVAQKANDIIAKMSAFMGGLQSS